MVMAARPILTQAKRIVASAYSKEQLLNMVASGMTLRGISAKVKETTGQDVGFGLIGRILRAFGEDYQQAKRDQAQWHAERVSEVSDDVQAGKLDPPSARVIMDGARWLASKMDPSQYGDKLTADITVLDVGALHLAALKAHMLTRARVVAEQLTHDTDKGDDHGGQG